MGHVVRSQGAAWSAHGSASGASRHRLLRRRGQGAVGAACDAPRGARCGGGVGGSVMRRRGHEVLAEDAGARARDVIGA